MTYAGFKSYVYAQLSRDDPRVKDAHKWIGRNYSVEHNPGLPDRLRFAGYYYYLMTMSRALDAWGSTHVETPDGARHDWANDIIDKLASLQRNDGSWLNDKSSRWMENNPNLTTAYALIALTHAIK
jgi:squalene-hopene/tetraprenyl-beta-curcumene cyclase